MINLFRFLRRNDDIIKDVVETVTKPSETPMASGDNGLMIVEDVFSITGRGTVVTGRVESGSFHINDDVRIVKADGGSIQTVITGIEAFRKSLDYAQAGDNVGLLVKDIARDQVSRGDRIES
jgi:elongation factor Tu